MGAAVIGVTNIVIIVHVVVTEIGIVFFTFLLLSFFLSLSTLSSFFRALSCQLSSIFLFVISSYHLLTPSVHTLCFLRDSLPPSFFLASRHYLPSPDFTHSHLLSRYLPPLSSLSFLPSFLPSSYHFIYDHFFWPLPMFLLTLPS